jgi:hypothetical protein
MEYQTDRWVGSGDPQNWPAWSPDLALLDFHVWGYVKCMVYEWKKIQEWNYFIVYSMLKDA